MVLRWFIRSFNISLPPPGQYLWHLNFGKLACSNFLSHVARIKFKCPIHFLWKAKSITVHDFLYIDQALKPLPCGPSEPCARESELFTLKNSIFKDITFVFRWNWRLDTFSSHSPPQPGKIQIPGHELGLPRGDAELSFELIGALCCAFSTVIPATFVWKMSWTICWTWECITPVSNQ